MKKLQAYLHFYRGIFILPFIVSLCLVYYNIAFLVAFITKILIFGIIWFFKYIEDRKDKKYFFYYNLDIRKAPLFAFSFIIDFILFLILFKLL